jgi:uncharacterized protein YbjT (DUF2867 family)
MILVFGAAGTCGASVVRSLVGREAKVRGFVRNEERAVRAREAGANEVAVGDLRDVASIEAACKGISGVFYVAPKFVADEASIGRMVVDVASRAGVMRFVYQSALHSVITSMPHHELKRQVEVALRNSDLEFTILQCARFMHNISFFWRAIVEEGIFAEPFSADVPISDVDFNDVAEVAALALTKPDLGRGSFELCAEGMLNRHKRAAILSEVLGRPVRAIAISLDEWREKNNSLTPFDREARALMFGHYDKYGFKGGNATVLRGILGREPASFRTFVEHYAAAAEKP